VTRRSCEICGNETQNGKNYGAASNLGVNYKLVEKYGVTEARPTLFNSYIYNEKVPHIHNKIVFALKITFILYII
jgi:hypothetical protein